jgi:hypothetical protein
MRPAAWVVLLSLLLPAWALSQLGGRPPQTNIVAQPEAPLRITRFFSRCDKSYSISSRTEPDGNIYHSVEYENISDRRVAGVRLGLLTFDQWRELLDGIDGISMTTLAPGETRMTTWADPVGGELVMPTTFAYVSKVRFSDGEVWSADLDRVLDELQTSGWSVLSLGFSTYEPEKIPWSTAADEPRREPPRGEPPEESSADDDFLDVEPVLEPEDAARPPL